MISRTGRFCELRPCGQHSVVQWWMWEQVCQEATRPCNALADSRNSQRAARSRSGSSAQNIVVGRPALVWTQPDWELRQRLKLVSMLVANLKRCSRAPLVYSPAGLSPPFRNRAVVFFMYHPLLNWRLWREVSRGYRFVPIREIREEPPIAQLVLGRWFSLADRGVF